VRVLTVYSYEKCSTCRKALAYLRDQGIACTVKPIREQPPSVAELDEMLTAMDGEMRKLFNTSGLDYRQQGLGAKLGTLTKAQALRLLAGNGNLVKRPFIRGDGVNLVGFDPERYRVALRPQASSHKPSKKPSPGR
jgi:arsenate reductase